MKKRRKKLPLVIFVLAVIVAVMMIHDYMMERRLNELKKESVKKVIYEMYPAAWLGGFPQMTEHLQRVAQLGDVDYIWLTPCYPSGGMDGGYDITDYKAIDPAYGTMEDFDNFVKTAQSYGMQVVLDLVLNHTSDQHPWFQSSVKGSPLYDDYYLWSDEDLGWGTMFDGSSAFEWNEERGQYYCHIYNKTQPDLNWENPDVMAAFQDIVDFWTQEHGVAGFRVDSAQLIDKNFTKTWLPRDKVGTVAGLLKYYQRSRTPKILNGLFAGRDLFTFGEMTAPTMGMFNQMVAPDGPLSAGFNLTASNAYNKMFGFVDAKPNLGRLERSMKHWSKHPGFIAMLESHDVPRFTSRAGVTGEEALQLLFGTNAQIVCLYQGEELGLTNPELSDDIDDYHDIQTIMRYESRVANGEDAEKVLTELKPESRDNARAPIDLTEYDRQMADPTSCWHAARNYIANWKFGNLER